MISPFVNDVCYVAASLVSCMRSIWAPGKLIIVPRLSVLGVRLTSDANGKPFDNLIVNAQNQDFHKYKMKFGTYKSDTN